MEAIAGNVFQGLASFAHEEFKLLGNSKHDVERMKKTVLAIRAIFLYAEEEANNLQFSNFERKKKTVRAIRARFLDAEEEDKYNHQVRNWLARLKDVLYDADDLLDDLSTEALRRKIMAQNKVVKEVLIFFSESNQLVYNLKMAHKLREVWGALDEIVNDGRQFHFTDQPLYVLEGRKQTGSFVQDEIIERENEKVIILRYLLNSNVKSSVSIIPIVGFGGVGKTALAQLVYNHEDVEKHFGLKRWVCVPDEFNVKQIAQKILGQEDPKEMEQVQQDLRQLVEGEKFLIVLDDVWNEDVQCWCGLKSLLTEGAEGSMIIVTTRSEKVGNMMGTHPPIILEGLDGKRSWELFCRMAFVEGREPNNKELIAVGREVVNKCGGVPLAIRAVGSLMCEKTLEGITDLSYLRNCVLWNVDVLEERVFIVLKLSFDHLPSPLKNCVAFCSLFPKNFSFKKQTLIQMWVAEGFIQPTHSMRCEEDVGNEYFMSLLSRSFFQDVIRDHCDNIVKCKMHDLVHDLALYVAKNEYHIIRDGKEKRTSDPTRHLSIDMLRGFWEVPTSFLKFEKLRTMLLLTDDFHHVTNPSVFYLVGSKLKCLRVLNLNVASICKIPNNIGKLKHLRFLDLSRNLFRRVPKALTRLHNLQTLDLRNNDHLLELPRDISKLVSLKHLYINGCWRLDWMPRGLGQLTSLQTLTNFVVAEHETHWIGARSARISELGKLNNLRGTLAIIGLNRLRSNHEEAESAKLKEKQYLQQLLLVWGTYRVFVSPKVVEDELILGRLRPHDTIKALSIKGFCGERLPEWIGDLLELQHLVLWNCEYLTSLPAGLHNLTSLRTLTIHNSPSLAGDERQKVAHIPRLDVDSMVMSGLLDLYLDQ